MLGVSRLRILIRKSCTSSFAMEYIRRRLASSIRTMKVQMMRKSRIFTIRSAESSPRARRLRLRFRPPASEAAHDEEGLLAAAAPGAGDGAPASSLEKRTVTSSTLISMANCITPLPAPPPRRDGSGPSPPAPPAVPPSPSAPACARWSPSPTTRTLVTLMSNSGPISTLRTAWFFVSTDRCSALSSDLAITFCILNFPEADQYRIIA